MVVCGLFMCVRAGWVRVVLCACVCVGGVIHVSGDMSCVVYMLWYVVLCYFGLACVVLLYLHTKVYRIITYISA